MAFTMTRLARHIDVGQEVHLDLDKSVAGAGFTPPALDVEAEAPWLIAARLAFGQPREPVADDCEGAGVGRGVGSRGAADRGLVDVDDLVAMFETLETVVRPRDEPRAVEGARRAGVECVDDEARLARSRQAGDAGERSEEQPSELQSIMSNSYADFL